MQAWCSREGSGQQHQDPAEPSSVGCVHCGRQHCFSQRPCKESLAAAVLRPPRGKHSSSRGSRLLPPKPQTRTTTYIYGHEHKPFELTHLGKTKHWVKITLDFEPNNTKYTFFPPKLFRNNYQVVSYTAVAEGPEGEKKQHAAIVPALGDYKTKVRNDHLDCVAGRAVLCGL